MKCLLLILSFLISISLSAQQLTIGTYNLRYDNRGDSGNLWVNREPMVASLIQFHDFDIIGTQEGLAHQLDTLLKDLPGYDYYGIGRDDGKRAGEHSAIFFKKDKLDIVKKGSFWLSETPDKPGIGWDAHIPRICSWILFRDKKTKKQFYFFNVHFDHEGVKARIESSKLILKKINEIAGNSTVILSGDFNASHNDECYRIIGNSDKVRDCYFSVAKPYAFNGTFNDFGRNLASKDIIDHIFVSKDIKVNKYGILSDSYQGKFPSDHFPVLVQLTL